MKESMLCDELLIALSGNAELDDYMELLRKIVPTEYLPIIWDGKKKEIVGHAARGNYIRRLPNLKNSVKKHLEKNSRASHIPDDVRLMINKIMGGMSAEARNGTFIMAFIANILPRFMRGEELEAWEESVALGSIAEALNLSPAARPDADQFACLCRGEDGWPELAAKFAPLLPLERAMLHIKSFVQERKSILGELGKIPAGNASGLLETPEDMLACETNFIGPWLILSRKLKNLCRALRRLSAIPDLGQKTIHEIMSMPDEEFDGIQQELLAGIEELLRPRLDVEAIIGQLAPFCVRRAAKDMERVKDEIDAVQNGKLALEKSWVLSFMLPVITGEIKMCPEILEEKEEAIGEECPYSRYLLLRLADHNPKFAAHAEAGDNEESVVADLADDGSPEADAREAEQCPGAEDDPPELAEPGVQTFEEMAENAEQAEEDGGAPGAAPELEATMADVAGENLEVEVNQEDAAVTEDKEFGTEDIACNTHESGKNGALPDHEFRPTETIPPLPSIADEREKDYCRPINVSFNAEDLDALGELGGLDKLFGQKHPREKVEGGKEGGTAVPVKDASRGAKSGFTLDCQSIFAQMRLEEEGEEEPDFALIGQAYARLLEERDSCGLCWLARTSGANAPLPIWLAELLYWGSHLSHAQQGSRESLESLCQTAAACHQELNEAHSLLLLAGLLRPALIMPNGNMNSILATLGNSLVHLGLAPLLKALVPFVSRGIPMEESILVGRTQKQLREIRLKRLEDRTRDFMQKMEKKKQKYAPASYVCKKLYSRGGKLRALLDAFMEGKGDKAIEEASQLKDVNWQNRLIEENSPPGFTRDIEAGARKKLHADMDACAAILQEWIECGQRGVAGADSSYQEVVFGEICQPLAAEPLERSAEGRFLLHVLRGLANADAAQDAMVPEEGLALWPFRLNCASPHWSRIFRTQQFCMAICRGEHRDDMRIAVAIASHAAHGWQAQPRALMSRLGLADAIVDEDSLPGGARLEDFVENAGCAWDSYFRQRSLETEAHISDCYFRGAINFDQQSHANASLNCIRQSHGTKKDKIPGLRALDELDKKLDAFDADMLAEVERRLQKLAEESSDKAQTDFIDSIRSQARDARNFIIAWDNVARLEDHLAGNGPMPVLQEPGKPHASVAPDFYAKLAAGAIRETASGAKIWREALNIYKDSSPTFFRVITELLRELGFDLKQTEKAQRLTPSGAPFFWRKMEYKMEIKSPMPLWGSEARGNHKITLAWGRLTPADIHNHMVMPGAYKQNDAVTIICFTSLSEHDRLRLLEMAGDWPVFPLIIDANLFNYIMDGGDSDRVKMLFDIALAGSPYNPYTPDASGAVPREMFVGRVEEKKQARNPYGTCLIYGGRQLGKSALLQQLSNEYKDDDHTVVFNLPLGNTATSLLDDLLRQCIKKRIVNPNTTRRTLPENILLWLEEDSARRMLVFLDESDCALDHDEKRNFEEAELLRNLMQKSQRRFKAVLTGLHSVQRFSHFPNSPLYHFGNPLCIGPLDREAAFQLMTEKMAILGIAFKNPQLVQMALNYCNYHPKLIQMFCSELLGAIRKKHKRVPCLEIDEASVREVYRSPDLNRKIKDCFSMTLDLDKRYFVIAYAMALSGDEGKTMQEIWQEARDCWPAAFRNSDLQTIQSLMSEMEGLGLVISLGGIYRLRTPNIVELLGGEDAVLHALAQYAAMDYTLPNDPNQLRIQGADAFVASQYNLLADKVNRLCCVTGSNALGLDKVPMALKQIADSQGNESGKSMKVARIAGMNVKSAIASLSESYDKLRSGGLIVWLSSEEFPFMLEFLDKAMEWLERRRNDKKFVKIVCMIGPVELFQLIRSGQLKKYETCEMPLTPWSITGIEDRCRDRQQPMEKAKAIHAATCGWPCLMEAAFRGESLDVSPIVEQKEMLAVAAPQLRPLLEQLPELVELENEGQFTESDLPGLLALGAMESETLGNCILFLKKLGLLREKDGYLRVDRLSFAPVA